MKNIVLFNNLLTITPTLIFIISACFLGILIVIYLFNISKNIKILKQQHLSIQREYEQKITILENAVSCISEGVPLKYNPADQQKKLIKQIETIIHEFSIHLNQTVQKTINKEKNTWHEKFSILLKMLGKTEKDLVHSQNNTLQNAWISIDTISQKSQLLFHDMKEDGIFYRLQSLWLLSDLCIQQKKYQEAWRHIIAGLKLLCDSRPDLPLTHTLAWQIAGSLYECTIKITPEEQKESLNKFHIDSQKILEYFLDLEDKDPHIEIIQRLRRWNHQIQLHSNQ